MSTLAPSPLVGPYGMILDEPNDTYHRNAAWSNTKLKVFMRQQHYAFRRYVERSLVENFDSEEFFIGRAAHSLVLEGDAAYHSAYVVEPDFGPQRKTDSCSPEEAKANKTRREAWLAAPENSGRITLTVEQAALNRKIKESVYTNRIAKVLLRHGVGVPEVTWRAKMPLHDVQCRSDWIITNASADLCAELYSFGILARPGGTIIVDFKTVATLEDDEWSNFEKGFTKYGYYLQAPFYQAVISEVIKQRALAIAVPETFLFIATGKREPFETKVYQPTIGALNLGWREVVGALRELNECYLTGAWRGVDDSKVTFCDVDEWYVRKQIKAGVDATRN